MIYEKCTVTELAQFVQDRHLVIPSRIDISTPKRAHRWYVAILMKADQEATFRFLDLAPEMRNHVYENLLTMNRSLTCHPRILRVNKQIHGEAHKLLVVKNIEVRLENGGVWVENRLRCGTYSFHGSPLNTIDKLEWPTILRKAASIRLSIPDMTSLHSRRISLLFTPSPDTESLMILNNVLYSLCSFLCQSGTLDSFEIDVPGQHSKDAWLLTLYPMHLLHRVEQIKFGDNIPLIVIQSVRQSARNPGPRNLLLHKWENIRSKLRICRQVTALPMFALSGYDDVIARAARRTGQLEHMLQAYPGRLGWVAEEWEDQFQQILSPTTAELENISKTHLLAVWAAAKARVLATYAEAERSINTLP